MPVFHKCATPPATSLAILMSERQGLLDFEKDIRKAVLVWDALPFLEPVAYWGLHDTLEQLKGTALKQAVTGQCGKIYTNDGTWLEDHLDEDEDTPLNYNDTAKTDVIFDGQRCPYNLAPLSEGFVEGLQDTGKDADEVKRFMQRREQSRARPRSSLRQVTSAADFD